MEPKNFNEFKLFDQIYLISEKITYENFISNLDKKKKILVILLKHNINDHLVKKLNKSDNIKFLNFQWNLISEYKHRWLPEKKSIDSVEKNFGDYENKIALKILSCLYNSRQIKLCIKKKLCEDLRDIILQLEVSKILKKQNFDTVNFFDKAKLNYFIKNNFLKSKNFENEKKVLIGSNIFSYVVEKIKFFLFFFIYPFYFLINAKKVSVLKNKKILGVRIYKDGFGFDDKKMNLNWIDKELKIQTSKILFIFETEINVNHLKDIKYQDYDYTFGSIKKPCYKISLYFIFQLIFLYIPMNILFSPIIIFSSKNFLIKEYFRFTCFLLIWKNLTNCYNFKNYISYHDYSPSHICRNIILKKKNTQTLMFKHTHSENIFDYKNRNEYAHSEMLNLYYDIEFHWSKFSVEMSKSNKSLSKSFEISGPIWSSKEFVNSSYQSPKKIISLFSSSFQVKNSITSNQGHKDFMIFINKILEIYPDYKIQLKPKYPLEVYDKHSEITSVLKNLKEFKNFEICDHETPSYKVINESDLIISTAFSSPTIEAIFMGKKSFYLDVSNLYKDNSFYNFNNFVANTIEDGLKNIDFWLRINSKDFKKINVFFYREMQVQTNSITPISMIRSRIINSYD